MSLIDQTHISMKTSADNIQKLTKALNVENEKYRRSKELQKQRNTILRKKPPGPQWLKGASELRSASQKSSNADSSRKRSLMSAGSGASITEFETVSKRARAISDAKNILSQSSKEIGEEFDRRSEIKSIGMSLLSEFEHDFKVMKKKGEAVHGFLSTHQNLKPLKITLEEDSRDFLDYCGGSLSFQKELEKQAVVKKKRGRSARQNLKNGLRKLEKMKEVTLKKNKEWAIEKEQKLQELKEKLAALGPIVQKEETEVKDGMDTDFS